MSEYPPCLDIEPCSDCPNYKLCDAVYKELNGEDDIIPLVLPDEQVRILLEKYKERVKNARRI